VVVGPSLAQSTRSSFAALLHVYLHAKGVVGGGLHAYGKKLSFQSIDDCKFHVGVVLSNVKGKNFQVLLPYTKGSSCVVYLNDKIKHLGVTVAMTH
jgi:hypothetical protein